MLAFKSASTGAAASAAVSDFMMSCFACHDERGHQNDLTADGAVLR